jgi:hypothetical protein
MCFGLHNRSAVAQAKTQKAIRHILFLYGVWCVVNNPRLFLNAYLWATLLHQNTYDQPVLPTY